MSKQSLVVVLQIITLEVSSGEGSLYIVERVLEAAYGCGYGRGRVLVYPLDIIAYTVRYL